MSKILVFGEVLWDVFDTCKEIGGAPFNFASHMAKLGDETEIVTALGNDDLGYSANEEIKKNNIGTKYVTFCEHETGRCDVTISGDYPHYDLKSDVAYDYIKLPEINSSEYDAFYFGSLASRSEVSRNTLNSLINNKFKTVFYDINVREPYFNRPFALSMIEKTDILKISREEAYVISNRDEITGSLEKLCSHLLDNYPGLSTVIVTLDKNGALLCDRKNGLIYSELPKSRPVSTVGAGDSFSAAYLHSFLKGKAPHQCLKAAIALSDYVVTKTGAVPDIPQELLDSIR